jgi:hypothetical protein
MANRTIRTARRREIVLDAISRGLTVDEAAREAGIGRRTLFDWRADDEDFRRDFQLAYDAGTDVFEAEARRRAFNESDLLLIFLLKCRDPERFNRKQVQVAIGGDPGAPPISVAAQENMGVRIYLPANQRERLPLEPLPPRTIDVEAEAVDNGAAQQNPTSATEPQQVDTTGWTWRKVT